MNNKKILYIRTDLGTKDLTAGGSVTHTLGVINGLLKADYSIVCASSAMHGLLKKLSLTKFKELYVPKLIKPFGFKISCFFSNIFFTWSVEKLFQNNTFEFIYQRYSMLNYSGVLLSWWFKVPLVLEFNGSEIFCDRYWAPNKKLQLTWLIRWVENINLKKAHYIVVVSQVLKDELVQQGIESKKIIVNPNGVDIDIFNAPLLKAERKSIRKQLGIEDKNVFGFIGTFGAWHGIEVILDMIPKLPDAHFLLIGSGPLLHKIQNKNFNNVTLVGSIAYKDAPRYLSACDVFLSPTQPNPDGSRFFGSPTKLFEYMSMAKPVIVSDLEQLADIVDEQCGIKIKPRNTDGFFRAARVVLDMDSTKRMQMGRQARQKVLNNYTWDCHVQHILNKIYEK